MSRIVTSISILRSLKDEAIQAAKNGAYPGISDFSSIVELALDRLLHPEKYLEAQPAEVEVIQEAS